MSGRGNKAALLGARFHVSELASGEVERTYVSSADERREIAGQLGLEALGELGARLVLAPSGHGGVTVTGEVEASLTQLCVVTLEPVSARVKAAIAEKFVPSAAGAGEQRAHHVVDIDDPDDAETFDHGEIDIGALVIDALATAIDPYPRAPDADLPALEGGAGEDGGAGASPFAALQALKSGKPAR